MKAVVSLVHKVKTNSSAQPGNIRTLQLATVKYSLRHVAVKSFTVPMGNRNIAKKNFFGLVIYCTRIVVGVVDNAAYECAIQTSPFNFKRNNINFITIYCNSVQIPSKLLQSDFSNDRFITGAMV